MGMYVSVYAVPPAALANATEVDELVAALVPSTMVSLEKAWHGLHYLLTGSAGDDSEDAPLLAFILQGGEPFGEDLGYGPARLLRPAQVKTLAAELSKITDDVLWQRFNPEDMSEQGIYPEIWDEDEEELKEEYVHYFNELKTLVADAAASGAALLIVLS